MVPLSMGVAAGMTTFGLIPESALESDRKHSGGRIFNFILSDPEDRISVRRNGNYIAFRNLPSRIPAFA